MKKNEKKSSNSDKSKKLILSEVLKEEKEKGNTPEIRKKLLEVFGLV